MVLRVIFWKQEGESLKRKVLRGIFGPKMEKVRGDWC